MNPDPILRRDFLNSLGGGFAGLALSQTLTRDAVGSTLSKPELNGGVSPIDTWDYKPEMRRLDGQKHRRSIYRFVWRGVPDPFMDTLDCPDLGMLAPSRGFSASALQSLALYNNRFVLHFSAEHAKIITTPTEAVRRILLRELTSDELRDLPTHAKKNSLAALCRMLINSREFLFVN